MFWADRVAADIVARFGKNAPILIRDEKTLSGRVHVGSMRGVAIHGAVHEALSDAGVQNIFKYEFNDFDPMDDIPSYLEREKFEKYLGMPLKNIPSPDSTASNFAEYFGNELQSVIEESGFKPEFYRGSELYLSGKMDEAIKTALTHAEDIRRIYKEVSGSQRVDTWLPINVICPQCGKITTTESSDFDGTTVQVHCAPNKVEYTKGCDFTGRVSPLGGNAKLPWKVEWAAKWKVQGVMVEGAGKDHSTKGGSRDVASHISKEVFGYEPPFDVPYEFFLVGGKKMSSSKGRGSSAREIADLLPPKIFRLALLGKDINQQVNFDPEGDTIPILFDQYDKLAEGYKTKQDDDYARLFEFVHATTARSESAGFFSKLFGTSKTHTRTLPSPHTYYPRFSQVAFMVQMPHLNMEEEFARMKGSALTAEDKQELRERADYAKRWLDAYAPEKFVFKIQETAPEETKNFSEVQKKALAELLSFIEQTPAMPSGEDLHHKLHDMKTSVPIEPAQLFSAIYLAILGKSYGPKAGWFLSVLDRNFLLKRLKEVTQ